MLRTALQRKECPMSMHSKSVWIDARLMSSLPWADLLSMHSPAFLVFSNGEVLSLKAMSSMEGARLYPQYILRLYCKDSISGNISLSSISDECGKRLGLPPYAYLREIS